MIHGQMKWVERDSFLRLTVLSPLMLSRMAVRVRQYTAQGKLVRLEQTFDVTSSSTKQVFFIQLREGWIESVSVGDSNFIVTRGRVFVQLAIQADNDKNSLPHTILAADYFVSSVGLQWPGTPIRHYRDGAGFLQSTNIGNPAAGANFSMTIISEVVWRIYGVAFRLTTDANVGNRRAILEVVIGGILAFIMVPNGDLAANQTFDYSFGDYGTHQFHSTSATLMIPFPSDLYLREGDILRSRVVGIQPGDQLSNIVVPYEEWVEER